MIYRATGTNGHEIRTVSLAHHITVTLFLLGTLGTVWGYYLGERTAQAAFVREARAEAQAVEARITNRMADDKASEAAAHGAINERVSRTESEVKQVTERLYEHIGSVGRR